MPSTFKFAEFVIDPATGSIAGPSEKAHVEPKIMGVLVALYSARGEVVSREDILQQVWPNQDVSDDVINNAISRIRKALSEVGQSNHYLETVPRKGYRLQYPQISEVSEINVNVAARERPKELSRAINADADTTIYEPSEKISNEDENLRAGDAGPLILSKVLGQETANDHIVPHNKSWSKTHWIAIIIPVLLLTISLPFIYAKWQHNNLAKNVLELHNLQKSSYSVFVIQAKRRNELVKMMESRLALKRTEQFEKFFSKYFPDMNKEEKFVFDQIRGITKGAMLSANTKMLSLIKQNPELHNEFPLIDALDEHLSFWVSKYQNVFLQREDMCLLYVGVEDEVPYPSELDKQVATWLQQDKL